ncbi:dnaJ homolog subfamily C member 21 isoform X2 [Panulirus ornatus]|uniref:dnaJ homolog subfamily C member 21 isoform X2 n=1 Tax=Panulirus ornatus TaxID=150431 RepID=UPI003A870CF9
MKCMMGKIFKPSVEHQSKLPAGRQEERHSLKMKCHYEVLGVTQGATDSELKKAYRKMALLWHPDKNPDNMLEAKTQFQLIQAAYDTLSDPQERAFYDRNRESILRGKAAGSDSKPEDLNLFKYFSSQCYSGFNDSEKGFYTVYRQVFEKISVMDMQYMDDEEEEIVIPNFGHSDADLEDVAVFYGYWSSYCSSMDFCWADEYDIREAQRMGRWVEKKIEKDNSKARQKARKQFNEEVRALVAFVRKRDKRWLARKKMMEAKVAENAEKQLAAQHRQREIRQEMMKENVEQERANLAAYEDELKAMEEKFAAEWGLTDSEDSDYSEEDEEKGNEKTETKDVEVSEEEFLINDLYCVACNKGFKTEKSMESHQRSKRHQENMEILKAAMTLEDKTYFKDIHHDPMTMKDDSLSDDDVVTMPKSSKKKKKKNRKNVTAEEPGYPHSPECIRKKKSRKRSRQNVDQLDINIMVLSEESEKEAEDSQILINGHNSTSENSKDVLTGNGKSEEDDIDSKEQEPDQTAELANSGGEDKRTKLKPSSKLEKDVEIEIKPKLKGKKARKQAQEAKGASQPDVKVNTCVVCGNTYPSKNKLFIHIKAEGHAALKTVTKEVKGKVKAKK